MASAAAKYKKAQEAVAKARKEAKATVKEAIKEMALEFFSKYPNVLSINWNQYTPHFNDGDPCNFSANVEYPKFTFVAKDGTELTYCAGAGSFMDEDDYDYDGDGSKYGQYSKERDKLEEAVVEFLQSFDEDDLEEMFGDGVEITITNKGKITTDSYEHD